MILVYGIPSEPPIALVIAELQRRAIDYRVINQRLLPMISVEVEWSRGELRGHIAQNREAIQLEQIDSVYARPTYHRFLPEYWHQEQDADAKSSIGITDSSLNFLLDNLGCQVINRPRQMLSNVSKPFQSRLIHEAGFSVPKTLITNDLALARAFVSEVGRCICKGISGEQRTIAREISVDELCAMSQCFFPIQIQELVCGTDIRVHVVGDSVFPCAVFHKETDYRRTKGCGPPRLQALDALPDQMEEACVALSRQLDLAFSGIDLRIAGDGRVFCFEVNPSPGYSYFELGSGLHIASALVDLLTG